jgi:hypothetical protein
MINYLVNNFSQILTKDQIRWFAFFLGENIHFLEFQSSYPFFPNPIADLIEKDKSFAMEIATAIANNLSSLNPEISEKLLAAAEKSTAFAIGFFSESEDFSTLTDENMIRQILQFVKKPLELGSNYRQKIGYSFGKIFDSIKNNSI